MLPPGATISTTPPVGTRRIRAFPRSDSRVQVQSFPNPAANEQIIIFSSGVNLVVDGMQNFGSIDLVTDRLVIWTSDPREPLVGGEGLVQSDEVPLELYMEGNIVFRQGDRTLYANRMYYDVRRQVGVVLDAEMLAPVPTYEGAVRVRAKVLEQVGPDRFAAHDASFTSSRLADPGYQLKMSTMTLTDSQQPAINPLTGQALIDPQTGAPVVQHNRRAEASGNTLYVGQVPVFYWPRMATNLEQPNFYVDNFQFRQDRVFGTQVFLDLNAYQLLGIKNRPEGTTWDFSTDYLSMRGPALGTAFTFDRPSLFGIPGRASGLFDAWGIHDQGHDNLGLNRRDLMPENGPWRGRMISRDRWSLPNNFRLTGELGLISDYNFQEQYFEQEWDQFKDTTTDLELYQIVNNASWSIYGQVRLNDFYTETNWLPAPGSLQARAVVARRSLDLVRTHQRRLRPEPDPASADQRGRPGPVRLYAVGTPPDPHRAGRQPAGRPRGHAARNRPAVRRRRRESRAIRAGRGGPLGTGAELQRSGSGLRASGRAGQRAVLCRQPGDPKPTAESQRAGAQGDVRRRLFRHAGHCRR